MTAVADRPPALAGETEREYAWRVYPNDAAEILGKREAPTRRCGQPLCRAPVWWGLTAARRRRTCFDVKPDGTRTGTNHWRTCRDRPGQATPRHRCPGPDCTVEVRQEQLACRVHWYALPKPLREEIWRFYRDGDHLSHQAAVREAVRLLNELHQPPAPRQATSARQQGIAELRDKARQDIGLPPRYAKPLA